MNAGILPYTFHNNNIYFLLGKEHYGRDKGKYSDFGGKFENNETPLQTAKREFKEESINVIPLKKNLLPIYNYKKKYVMYLMEIKYNKNINKIFKNKRNKCTNYSPTCEKSIIKWMSHKEIMKRDDIRKSFLNTYKLLIQQI